MSERPRAQRYVRCLVCDRAITLNNLTTHIRTHHPASAHLPRRELYDELGSAAVPAVDRSVNTVPPAPAPQLAPLGPDDLDAIVLAVVDNIAKPIGMLPVAHLPAVFAWRDATATFLRSVRGLEAPGEAPRSP